MDTDTKSQKGMLVDHQILRRLRGGRRTNSFVAKDPSGKKVILTYFDYDKAKEQYRALAHTDGVPTEELDSVAEPQAKRVMEDFKQAAVRVKGLERDYVGQIFDWGFDKATNNLVVIQEYIPGVDIAYALEGLKPIHSIALFAQAAKGLENIHKSGFLHLNIKPNRILVNFEGDKPEVKITDFGFAIPKVGYTGEYYGSVHYIAPEVIFNDRAKIDERADMFSFGATMYYALTKRYPFIKRDGSHGNRRKLKVIVEREKFVEPPSYTNREMPKELEQIMLGLLEHDPDKRAYKTATVLLNALHNQWPKESLEMPIDGTSTLLGKG